MGNPFSIIALLVNKKVCTIISDGIQVPILGSKPGFFPFEWVRFFRVKTRVPSFPIFKIM